jgi:hypothetical protein
VKHPNYRVNFAITALLLTTAFQCTPPAIAATQPQIDAMRAKSLAYLVSQQQGDGSWRDAGGNGMQATATGIEALTRSGMTSGYVPGAAASWLLNAEAASIDSLARQIAALARMGVPVNDLVSRLLAARDPFDGGWGAYAGFQTTMPDTALAYDALLASNSNVPTDAQLSAITGLVATDGGWPYRIDGVGAKSALVPTAYGVLVLSRYVLARPSAATAAGPSLTNGINWLLAHKKSDGGYAEDMDTSGTHNPAKAGKIFETALVQLALTTAKQAGIAAAQTAQATQALTQIDDFLVARQSADGSWNAEPIQTATVAQALPAITLADGDHDGLPDIVEPLLNHNAGLADSRDLPKGNGNPIVTASTDSDGDVPLPPWAIAALGASLLGILRKQAKTVRGPDAKTDQST